MKGKLQGISGLLSEKMDKVYFKKAFVYLLDITLSN